MQDQLSKFVFEPSGGGPARVRGEIVDLSSTWREIRNRHDYPAPVTRLLGEMVAAGLLLTANLKFNGTLIMQVHGDGPVRLLVVECSNALAVRATAKLAPDARIPADSSLSDLLNQTGRGRFALTLDRGERRAGQLPYQGMVPLEGDSMAQVLENYLLRSEQLSSKLWLAADDQRARGLLLQQLPQTGGWPQAGQTPTVASVADEDTWDRVVALSETLNRDELLATDTPTLMRRLYWEETLRVFDPLPCHFSCTCTRERVAAMLVTLGPEEVEATLREQGGVHVNCDFCNRRYDFDAVDCAQLFATDNTADAVRAAPQDQRH